MNSKQARRCGSFSILRLGDDLSRPCSCRCALRWRCCSICGDHEIMKRMIPISVPALVRARRSQPHFWQVNWFPDYLLDLICSSLSTRVTVGSPRDERDGSSENQFLVVASRFCQCCSIMTLNDAWKRCMSQTSKHSWLPPVCGTGRHG